jgi:hypothetical protein
VRTSNNGHDGSRRDGADTATSSRRSSRRGSK